MSQPPITYQTDNVSKDNSTTRKSKATSSQSRVNYGGIVDSKTNATNSGYTKIQPGEKSLLDRDGPRYIKVIPDRTPEYVIGIIIVFICALAFLVILYLWLRNPPTSDSTKQKDEIQPCPISYCATNIYTGAKRCPEPDNVMTYNVTYEVCNPAAACTSPTTPYALNSDGSVKFNGLCSNDSTCPCIQNAQCANYITSYFTAVNGDPYSNNFGQNNILNGSNTIFVQQNVYNSYLAGAQAGASATQVVQSTTPPLILPNPVNSFCSIPISWLSFSTPGCNFTDDINKDNLAGCMNLPNISNSNPCLQGTLALLPDEVDTFNIDEINRIGVACVNGKPCSNDSEVALYDQRSGTIVCYKFK